MGSSRGQLAAALLLLSAFTLSHTATATFTSSNFWDFSVVHVGYKSPCTSKTSLQCTNDNDYDFANENAPKSCNQITVGCYSSYYTAQCSWERDDYCPSCSVVNGKVVLKCTKQSGSSCANPKTYNPTGFCGDPHFAAPGGIFFDWHGKRDQDFAIISDTNFQLNAHFIGERTDSQLVEKGTWMQEISMGYKNGQDVHFLSVGIDQDKDFDWSDVLYFTFDGEDVPVGSGTATYTWTSPDGKATVTREPHKRAQAQVRIDGLFEATFYPRVESRIQLEPLGKYLDMDMENLNITRHSHGILGQMFRPDAVERKDKVTTNTTGHEFLVEGRTEDYRVTSLQSYDNTFNQFDLKAGLTVKSVALVDADVRSARKMLSAPLGVEGLGDVSWTAVRARCEQKTGSLVCA